MPGSVGETFSNLVKRLSGLRPNATFGGRSKRSSSSASPRSSDSTQATHGNPTPRLSTKASREARIARSIRFQEDEIILMREIGDLIGLKTASPTYVLKRLAALPADLSDAHRRQLVKAARAAVQVAYCEFERARSAGREKMPEDAAFERMCRIPFADLTELGPYVSEVVLTARDLRDSTLGFGVFEAAEAHCKGAEYRVRKACVWIERGGAAAEHAEIRWTVERKCMYWAAVAMMDARIDARIGDTGPEGGSSTARKTSMADKTSPKEKTRMAEKPTVTGTASTECSEVLPKVYQRPIDGA